MSDVVTPEEVDLTTDEGFMASLQRDLGIEVNLEGESAPAPAVSEEVAATEEAAVPEGAPEMVTKAQYDELFSLMGRQTAELGELRKAVTPEPEPEVEQTFYAPPLTDEVEQELQEAIDRQGGAQIAAWAATNRPDLYDYVLDAWANTEDNMGRTGANARRAAEFNLSYQMEYARIQAETQAEESRAFQSSLEGSLDSESVRLAPEYGLQPADEKTDLLLAETLDQAPASIQRLVTSRDAGEREEGLRTIFVLAQARLAAAGIQQAPVAEAQPDALQAALAVAKGAAAVGTSSLRPADAPAPPPAGSEAALFSELQNRLRTEPSTSVASGLTFGNK